MSKLVLFIGALDRGGAEKVAAVLSSFYCNHFDEVVVLTYYNAVVFYELNPKVRHACVEQETHTQSIVKNLRWIRGFAERERPNVWLSLMMPFNIISIWALFGTRIPVVVCERSDPRYEGTRVRRIVRNFSYHFCFRIQLQTAMGKACFSKRIQKKITVIPNPNHITIEQRNNACSQPKEKRIVSVGRLIPLKNNKLLIDAFAMVHKKHPDYQLCFYGDGPLEAELRQYASNNGLEDNKDVVFCGQVKDVINRISPANIFVLSSIMEGMPNALMEAVALGIPSISTDVSGARDIITDGESGYIVPVGDKDALAKRLIQLIESEETRKRFSEASVSVIDKFDKEKILKQWLEFVTI